MSDIFISHKREDQEIARRIANALETEGWTVWWDPKLRAGEHFDEVIEEALTAAKCVVVLWSAGSVKSQYVRDEATYALECKKLVPVAIEAVEMPFRFRGVHTLRLFAWDGSRDSTDFRRLVHHRRSFGRVRQETCWRETEVPTICRGGDERREHLERSQRTDLFGR